MLSFTRALQGGVCRQRFAYSGGASGGNRDGSVAPLGVALDALPAGSVMTTGRFWWTRRLAADHQGENITLPPVPIWRSGPITTTARLALFSGTHQPTGAALSPGLTFEQVAVLTIHRQRLEVQRIDSPSQLSDIQRGNFRDRRSATQPALLEISHAAGGSALLRNRRRRAQQFAEAHRRIKDNQPVENRDRPLPGNQINKIGHRASMLHEIIFPDARRCLRHSTPFASLVSTIPLQYPLDTKSL